MPGKKKRVHVARRVETGNTAHVSLLTETLHARHGTRESEKKTGASRHTEAKFPYNWRVHVAHQGFQRLAKI